jgi:signal transduction histidine kinase
VTRSVASLVALVVATAWLWFVLPLLEQRTQARVEAERDRRHRRLDDATLALSERVDRSSDLVRALADAASLREVVLSSGVEQVERWALVDRLLPRLAAEKDILSVAVLLEDGAPLASFSKRFEAAPPPLSAPRPPAVMQKALDAAASVVAFDLLLDPTPRLLAAVAVDGPARRAVVVVEVDAGAAMTRLESAAADGSWALMDEDGRVLAPRGGAAVVGPAGQPARGSGTLIEGDELASTITVAGVPRGGWQLRARSPARAAGEVSRELLETLGFGGLPLLAAVGVGVWLVVTGRRQREGELQRRFLQTVFNAITDPLVVVGPDLVVTHANRAAETRYGAPLVGRRYVDTVAASRAAPQAEEEALREVLRGQKQRRAEVDDAKGGAWQVVRYPMRTDEGDVEGVVEYARDVTETRRLQAQLVQSEKLSTLGEMAAGVAHEINNPIGVVSMFAQLLQEELKESLGPDAPALEKLRTIEEQAVVVAEIVQGMLRFSRKSEGPRVRLDVRAAIEHALSVVEHRKVLQGVSLERAFDVTPPPEVVGNQGQLAQVVLNLVVNAAHAMRARGGAVRLSIARAGEDDPYPMGRPFGEVTGNPSRVRVAVQDQGQGIPPDVLDRIFEPFFTTKPVGEGTGLGLSVSFGIIREHGGCIWVHSEAGLGTTFTLDLPAAEDDAAPEGAL